MGAGIQFTISTIRRFRTETSSKGTNA
jgi:hypothetical protein